VRVCVALGKAGYGVFGLGIDSYKNSLSLFIVCGGW
jgi:hypothetical protein